MHYTHTTRAFSRTILTGSFALLFAAAAFAGTDAKDKVVLEPKIETKPEQKGLVFWDGKLTIDIEERLRFEARDNNRDFDSSINDDNDDSWLLNRARIGIAVKPTSWVKFYAQGQDTREWDSDRPNIPGVHGTEGGDEFDLRQAYVEFADYKQFPFGVKIGRQGLDYGDNRLVADSKWANFGRTFDAVKLRFEKPDFGWIEAFAARPVQIREHHFDDSDSADNFFGLYASLDFLKFQATEFYVFHRDKADNQPDLDPTNIFDAEGSWNGPAQRITTIGTRWASKKQLAPWDYTLEAAFQFGDLWATDRSSAKLDQQAFALHVHGGYTWEQASWKPRLGLEYNYASGDDNSTDGDSGSFQNLFPSNFAPYGYIDFFSWRNMHNARVQFTVEPCKQFKAEVSYHAFWLAETTDYWFRSNGYGTVRTKTPDGRDVRTIGVSNFAGHEIDLQLTWKPTDYLTVLGGYSHFFAGDYLSETGADSDADFAYLQATVNF
jgi:hypothetical protein